MKPQLTNSTIKTNKSTPLLTSNARIMKLIQNKKYPLRNGQKSELIFPKIKQRYKEVDPYIPPKVKKYVQINLKEEETNLFVPVPQEQLWQKYGIRSKAIQQQQINSKNHLNSYLQIIKKGPKKMNERQQQIIKKQNSTFNEYSCFPLVEGEQVLHAREYKNIITQQSQKNNSFLERIRESINSKKINYLKNVKPSEVLEGGNEKENYSFEYLVNKIESRNIKDSNLLKESAFQSLSPNRLKDYIDIFRCSKQNEKDLQNKQKECKQENLQTSEKIKNQNNAVLDKYSSFITSSLPSVQERLKVRYNKMIEVQKGK